MKTESEKLAVIRLPKTTMPRKNAWLKAAQGIPLVQWIFNVCDSAASYKPNDWMEKK